LQPENVESFISGSEKLTGVFGYWPSFHDAEVIELHLSRGDALTERRHPRFPILTTKIHLWELTNEVDARGYFVLKHHTLATLRFHDVLELEMEGFNQQNALSCLLITPQEHTSGPWNRTYSVTFQAAFGMAAQFRCSRIEVVDATPWEEESLTGSRVS